LDNKIEIGSSVYIVTGDYTFDGTVVAVFFTLAGNLRYVVEHDGTHMLHIVAVTNIKRR
jgi:hypothetical protein